MKRLAVLIVLAIAGLAGYALMLRDRGESRATTTFRTVAVDRGDILAAVSATGTVAPTTTVIVGSQLSGQVVEVLADYNSEVKAGQVLARLNRLQIEAKLDAARADLAQAQATRLVQDAQAEKIRADIARAEAVQRDIEAQARRAETLLADAERTLARQIELRTRGIATDVALQNAQTQRDALTAALASAKAQTESARAQIASLSIDGKVLDAQKRTTEATIQQKSAVVRQIEVDLGNSEIRSPVDGVVVQRNIELGATVAASLTAPTLFLVAQDLRRIEIQANIDEADVGRVQRGARVSFQVTAYPGRSFAGTVRQVRLGSQTVQNVVIYTAVIDVNNADLALLPGMTASLRIFSEERQGVLRVPNAALRWRPPQDDAEPAASAPPSAPQIALAEAGADAAGPFTGGPGGAADRQVQRLTRDLGLSEDQGKAIAEIFARAGPRGTGGGQMRADAARGEGGRRGGAPRPEVTAEIEAVLTAAQKEKWREMRAAAPRGGGRPSAGVAARVYIIGPDGAAKRVTIRAGVTDGSFTEIIGPGLEAGQALIVGGAGLARPGAAPRLRMQF